MVTKEYRYWIDKLLIEIYLNGWFLKQCKNITKGNSLEDDLMSHLSMKLLTKEYSKLIELYKTNDNYLAYLYRVIKIEYSYKSSSFYKLYRNEKIVELTNLILNENDEEEG